MTKRKYDTDGKAATTLAEALENLPDEFIRCRDLRHSWDVLNDFHVAIHVGQKIQEIHRDLICLRCTATRKEVYHRGAYGGLLKVSNSYKLPKGYQIHGVPRGNKPASIVQGEMYRRTLEKLAKIEKSAQGA